MIYNLGTTVPLQWVNGVDLGPATLAVTDPNGVTTSTPNITSSAGTYSGSFLPAAAGLHTVLWTAATGATKGAFEDVFEVRPNTLLALISVADAREHLRLRSSDTSDNPKIQSIIEASSRLIVDITGPMTYQNFSEWYDGGLSNIVPEHLPLVQVTAAAEYYGLSKFILTEQPLGLQTNAFAFTVDYVTGQITRRTYGGAPAMFAIGAKNVNIQYKAGRALVPENVQLATKELVRHLYQETQVQGRPKHGSAGEDPMDNRLIGYAVPNFVAELLQPDRRAPGIA